MKILIFLLMIISLNGCSIFGYIRDETDKKIAFLQSIVDNPEQIDSIVKNSVYFHKDIPIFWVDDIRLELFHHKGNKIKIYLNYNDQVWTHNNSELIKRKLHKISILFDNSKSGLFAIFRLIDNKWYINSVDYLSKEQMDNFEEPRDLIPTITN